MKKPKFSESDRRFSRWDRQFLWSGGRSFRSDRGEIKTVPAEIDPEDSHRDTVYWKNRDHPFSFLKGVRTIMKSLREPGNAQG
jgi:hypothetical protein